MKGPHQLVSLLYQLNQFIDHSFIFQFLHFTFLGIYNNMSTRASGGSHNQRQWWCMQQVVVHTTRASGGSHNQRQWWSTQPELVVVHTTSGACSKWWSTQPELVVVHATRARGWCTQPEQVVVHTTRARGWCTQPELVVGARNHATRASGGARNQRQQWMD